MNVLTEMLTTRVVLTQSGNTVELHSGIDLTSAAKMEEIVKSIEVNESLEVGMACGVSTLAIMGAHPGHHTAIDPNQTEWGGIGVTAVNRAGYSNRFKLIEESSHTALPRLVTESRKIDFIFIDGWHSFDYTFLDIFYADQLLRDGGILAIDDTGMPQVGFAIRFLITHKPYRELGPCLENSINPIAKLKRRILKDPDHGWGSIRAYQKTRSSQVHWGFFESDFYPGFRLYKLWMKLKGLPIKQPF